MRAAIWIVLLWALPAEAARFAVVQADGKVVTVVEAPDAPSVVAGPDQQVVEVPSGVPASTGSTYSNGTFLLPPIPNSTLIERKLDAAIDSNLAYLALTQPTNAQTVAQVVSLTRQVNGILRLLRNRLDAVE